MSEYQPTGSAQRMQIVANRPLASAGTAYIFWLLLGVVGGHQFYMGKTGRGLLYLFTLGGFFILLFIDLFTIPSQVRAVNAQRMLGLQ
jgi:TM2 domain-containing membrane protein YozV